ncbi:MAG TPA: AMP-binding protein [Rhodanobacteraceae bacterium]|nr:AMP-binding protein [Rhodanobacteraceae bacterium]
MRTCAWRAGRPVSVAAFLADVAALAARLPAARAAVNLCEDRYAFLVAFAALLVRDQVNLLPPSRAPEAVAAVLAAHPAGYSLGDTELTPAPPRYLRFQPAAPTVACAPVPTVDPEAVAAVAYTSGSTGAPKANVKRLDRLAISSAHNDAVLRELAGGDYHVVATVPPQHMYGLETSVLLPLFGFAAAAAERPFFPADVAAELARVPEPRILVTTPVHLRALVDSGQALPCCAGITSATAPLAPDLAQAAEARFGAPVQEVFGSTETCVIAHRRSARGEAWTPYAGVTLHPQPDGTRIEAPQLAEPVVLADIVEVLADGRFRLRGRNTDLLEIAGKRASLGDLTHKLLAIPGVRDGAVFQLDEVDAVGVRRIAALVVAPGIDPTEIVEALRRGIDPVFLPRPLKRVDALPRSETGKLPRAALLEAFRAA